MGIKISALPPNAVPYTGSEEFPLVQERETRAGTLSSLVNYLSGDFAFVNRENAFTRSQNISGDLTVTGTISATVFNAVSANFSIIDIKQYELSGFSVAGDVSLTGDLSGSGNIYIDGLGIIDTDSTLPALRVTQRGTGPSLLIEDTTNTDVTPFIITSGGNVGVGVEAPNEKLTVIGRISSTDGLTTTGASVFDVDSSQAALRVTQHGSGKAIVIEDSANPDATSLFVDASGRVVIGALTSVYGGQCEIYSNNTTGPWVALKHYANTNDGSYFAFVKTRGDSPESNVPVVSNDNLGTINFQGTDGTKNRVASFILSEVDGTPQLALSSIPGRLVFGTTLSGLNYPSERMRITNTGNVGIGTTAPSERLTVIGNISATGSITTSNTGIIDTNSSQDALRVTQRGSGLALRVEDEANIDSTPFAITSGGDVGVGTITPNQKLTVVGNTSATGIAYTQEIDFGSSERPSLTGIKQALNSFLYVSPALSYMRINGSSSITLEVGQSLSNQVISWTSNKVESAAVSGYRLTLPTGVVLGGSLNHTFSSYTDTNTYDIDTIPGTATQATSSWTVRVTDWANASNTATATASWRYRVYYGATNQLSPTDTIIRDNADDSVLATSRTGLGSKTVYPSNEYLYVAYPARFGVTSLLKINGFNFTDMTLVSITSFTNAFGGTGDYYVYRTNNLLAGTYAVEII